MSLLFPPLGGCILWRWQKTGFLDIQAASPAAPRALSHCSLHWLLLLISKLHRISVLWNISSSIIAEWRKDPEPSSHEAAFTTGTARPEGNWEKPHQRHFCLIPVLALSVFWGLHSSTAVSVLNITATDWSLFRWGYFTGLNPFFSIQSEKRNSQYWFCFQGTFCIQNCWNGQIKSLTYFIYAQRHTHTHTHFLTQIYMLSAKKKLFVAWY